MNEIKDRKKNEERRGQEIDIIRKEKEMSSAK